VKKIDLSETSWNKKRVWRINKKTLPED